MLRVRTERRKCAPIGIHFFGRSKLISVVVTLCVAPAFAQCVEQQTLSASDANALDGFGSSLSVSADTSVVGAPGDDCSEGSGCGAVYVFGFNGSSWVEVQKLVATDARAFDSFGSSVSASGATVVVGVPYYNCLAGSDCGAAYAYRFNGTSWAFQHKLLASDAAADDHLGRSVSVSGDVVVLGADGVEGESGRDSGSAYVFRFNGSSWDQEQELFASDAGLDDFFGNSVFVEGDTAIVGAHRDDCPSGVANSNCGSAYVFRFNGSTWVEEQKLTALDAATGEIGDLFGTSVAVHGEVAVVGAIFDDYPGVRNCGSASVFRFNGMSWVHEQTLIASDPATDAYFGQSVSISGNRIVVGAEGDDCPSGVSCGAAYAFGFNGKTWVEEWKLTAADAADRDAFGSSVSVSGGTVLAGARLRDCPAGDSCGAAYVFPELPLRGDFTLDGMIDHADHEFYFDCAAGPEVGVLGECHCADMDGDGDVDFSDWAKLQLTYPGS